MEVVTITVLVGDEQIQLKAQKGENLRALLLRNGLSPYAKLTRKLNCGGRGLCATCGVQILEGDAPPNHWHDQLANRFRYPRLSCQLKVQVPLKIRLITEKKVWGKRIPRQSKEGS